MIGGNLISQVEEAASPVEESYLTKNFGWRSKKAIKTTKSHRKTIAWQVGGEG
jgi:hypothetical protein